MQNKLLTKAAFTLLAATLLQACGGGGDSSTPSNTLTNTTPVSSDPTPLSVVTELQPNIKNLSTDWPTGVTVGNDNTLTFAGSPQLAKGDIFVVNSTVYKVEGIGGTPSATQVTVSEPALNEVYKKVEFSGKSDALEFIPNPELGLQPVAVAPENQGFQLGLGIVPTDSKGKLTLSKNSDGFYTVKYAVEKGFNGFSVKGALTVGAKAEVSQWDVISNKGHGQFDIFVEPSLMVSIFKDKNNLIDKSGICSSKSNLRGANYILLGTIPMSKALAAVPVAGALLTSTVSMNIPVCLSMSASTDMNLDLLQLSGKFQVSMFVGNQQAPHFNNTQSLTLSVPADSATLSEAILVGGVRYTEKAQGEMALEAGLELGDNLNLVNVGAAAAAVIKASLEGDFGVSLLYKSLRGIIAEPDACLTINGEGVIRAKGQTSFFWGKNLSVVQEIPLKKIPEAKFGTCQLNITISPLSDSVPVGGTRQFVAEIKDSFNNPVSTVPKLQWESSDPTVATVSATGLVTAIKGGSANITVTDVTDMDKKKSATATVTVDLSTLVKISITGEKLPRSATEWSCVLDKAAGLMWEHKTNDGGGLRDEKHTYTWFEDSSGYADVRDYDIEVDGEKGALEYGRSCNYTLAKCNTKAYAQAINGQKLCGYSDWRLPTKSDFLVLGPRHPFEFYEFGEDIYRFINWRSSTLSPVIDLYTGKNMVIEFSFDAKGSAYSFDSRPSGHANTGVMLVRDSQ